MDDTMSKPVNIFAYLGCNISYEVKNDSFKNIFFTNFGNFDHFL